MVTTTDELHPELSRIAEEKTVVAGGVDRFRSEQAGRKRAPCAADTMNADDVE